MFVRVFVSFCSKGRYLQLPTTSVARESKQLKEKLFLNLSTVICHLIRQCQTCTQQNLRSSIIIFKNLIIPSFSTEDHLLKRRNNNQVCCLSLRSDPFRSMIMMMLEITWVIVVKHKQNNKRDSKQDFKSFSCSVS